MLSTRQAAKRLGLSYVTLSRYIAAGKIPTPKVVMVAGMRIHDWTEGEIEHVRKLLPKIANGRKTRYAKKHSAVSTQQSEKAKTKRTKKKK
jgi:excisionase family DNA binding protein